MNMIRLYGYSECPYCNELEELLKKGEVKYMYIDVTKKENENECNKIFEIAGEETVPIVLVNKKVLVPDKSFKTISEAYELVERFINE